MRHVVGRRGRPVPVTWHRQVVAASNARALHIDTVTLPSCSGHAPLSTRGDVLHNADDVIGVLLDADDLSACARDRLREVAGECRPADLRLGAEGS